MSSFKLKTAFPIFAAFAATVLLAPGAGSQTVAIRPGDLAVTGFSGTLLSGEAVTPGRDPADRTFIDLDGASLRIFDTSHLGASRGDLVAVPVRLEIAARDIGQVFGLAFDEGTGGGPSNLYVAASTAFGLRIVGGKAESDGKPARLKEGALDARFMEGQFGALSSDSPGAIYRIDGATGAVSYYADTAFTGVANSGPGLGALAYDAHSRMLYASDLDTGLIHRFGLDYNAAALSQFDHGVAGRRAGGLDPIPDDGRTADLLSPNFKADDPATWGFTQPERRINALAVHKGRLYYAVAAGPEIWSVGLNGGEFMGDARREVSIKAAQPFPVTGITFDGNGRMVASQRGTLKSPYDYGSFVDTGPAQVLRYAPEEPDDTNTPDRWRPDQDYAVGQGQDGRMATGGVGLQYGYRADGSLDPSVCAGSVALTGDGLRGGAAVHGVELNALDATRPPSGEPPAPIAVLAFDARQDEPDLRGHVGNVAAFSRCEEGAPGFPPIADAAGAGGAGFPPVADGAGGGAGFPPVADGAAGGGAGFPPVEDGGAGGGAGLPPVGPGGSNLSVTKTQSCKLVAADKAECEYTVQLTNTTQVPFLSDGLTFADRFSTAPQSFTTDGFGTPNTTPGGFDTNPSRFGFTSFPPGPAGFNSKIKATFAVPAGGLVVENCITLKIAAGGAPLTPEFILPEPPPPQPDLPATTTNGLDRAVAMTGTPQCTVRGSLRDCTWTVTVSNPGSVPTSMSFTVATSIPNLGMGSTAGVGVSRKSDTTTQFANSDPLPPKAVRSFTVRATFPAAPPGPISAEASVATQFIADVNAANDTATASAGTVPPQVIPSPGVTSADANPGDNRSCIKWDSKLPDNQGAPTTDPTVPPPATPPPMPSQAGPLSLAKTGGACRDNRFCDFTIVVSNTSATPFTGKVEFDDGVTGDGAIFGATAITPAPAAPWSCAKAPQGFKCAANLTIPANSAAPPLKLTFDLGPGIGAVKEVRNCATLTGAQTPSCATIPMQAQPPGPGAPPTQLSISKRAVGTCSDLGGNCRFVITVSNPTANDIAGPIEIEDQVTVGGQIVPTTQMDAVANKPWTCLHKGQGAFSCTHPGPLKAGEEAELNISIFLNAKTDATHVRNCANLKGSPAKACADIPLLQGPKLAFEKTATQGFCNPNCSFRIFVINVGNAPHTGPVEVVDFLQGPITLGNPAFVSANAPWTCQTPGRIVCSRPGPLAPKDPFRLDLTLKYPPARFTAENCAGQANIPVADMLAGKSCAPISNVPPPELQALPNIMIEKQAPNADAPGGQGSCRLGELCRFTIIVTNTGDADYKGKIRILDNVENTAGQPRTPDSLGKGPGSPGAWECTSQTGAANIISCEHPDVTLPKNASLRLEVMTVVGRKSGVWKKDDILVNCATFSYQFGNDKGGIKGDDRACASVKLDPFALEITKSGDQSCRPGSECRFQLSLTNPGPIDHNAPVTFTDGLTGAPAMDIVSIVPPLPCAEQPTKIPFKCTTPGDFSLPFVEPPSGPSYTITVRVPNDVDSFTNCAFVTTGDRAQPETGAGDSSNCHKVTVGPPRREPQPSPPTCAGGMFLTREGLCACPPGQRWSGRRCIAERAEQPPPRRPDGSAGSDRVEQPPERCPSSRPVGRPPNCCPRGTVYLGGACRKPTEQPPVTCPPERPVGKPPNCCPAGTRFVGGACRRPGEERECPPGTRGRYPNCQCPLGMSGTPPNCCPPGTRFLDGKCQRPQRETPRTCPADRPVGTPPNCCPRGMVFIGGACIRPKPQDTTPRVCPPDRPVGKPPNCCPRGMVFVGGACIRPQVQPKPQPEACTGGMVGTPPSCKCPQGTRYSPTTSRRTKGRVKCISVQPDGPIVR